MVPSGAQGTDVGPQTGGSAQSGRIWRLCRELLVPAIYVILALATTALLLSALKVNPLFAYKSMILGAVGSSQSISDTLSKMVPIGLIALGIAGTFRCGVWNIGGEGQFYAGAICAGLTGILIDAPAWILIPLEAFAGMVAGALTASIPALLKIKLKANEVLVTLMLNFIPIYLTLYIIHGPFSEGLSEKSVDIHPAGELDWFIAGNLRIHAGLLVLILAVFGMSVLMDRSTFGFKIRAVGSNVAASRAVGIDVGRTYFLAFILAGALAGLSGMLQVTAVYHNLLEGMSPGYGFTALIVALLGRLKPWAILVASFGFAALLVGGDSMQRTTGIESSTVLVIEGLILLFLLGGRIIGRESASMV